MEKTPLKQRADFVKSLNPIVYHADKTEETLTEFLTLHKPSETHSDKNISWIEVRGKMEENENEQSDYEGLLKKWEDLMSVKTQVTTEMMKQLAIDYNVKVGFWFIIVPFGSKAEIMWKKIATGIVENNLNGCSYQARISSAISQAGTHVIFVYNEDFTNDEQVFALEKAIRTVGVKCTMKYKPTAYSQCGIYRDVYSYGSYRLHKNMRPTILTSNFDVIKRESRVITHDGIVVCVNRISDVNIVPDK